MAATILRNERSLRLFINDFPLYIEHPSGQPINGEMHPVTTFPVNLKEVHTIGWGVGRESAALHHQIQAQVPDPNVGVHDQVAHKGGFSSGEHVVWKPWTSGGVRGGTHPGGIVLIAQSLIENTIHEQIGVASQHSTFTQLTGAVNQDRWRDH